MIGIGVAIVTAFLPVVVQAATSEVDKAREKLAKDGTLFTVGAFLDLIDDAQYDKGARKKVELFLTAGMDVNSPNERGETALLKAVESDDAPLVSFLLAKGADVNARTTDGETALYKNVRSGRKGGGRVVRAALIAAKADVKIHYRRGETALHAAASSTHAAAMKDLLAAGAEVDARDEQGQTTLYECACTGRTDEMQVLIEAGADVNTRTLDGETPLLSAAVCGEADVITTLLKAKADPRLADKHGRTALHQVAQFNMHFVETGRIPEENLTRIVQELVAAGADVNAVQKHDGATPLIAAATRPTLPVLRALIAAGANVNAKTTYGKTALQEAKDKPEVVAVLKEAGAKPAAGPKK